MHANTEIHKVLLWPFWEPNYTNTSNMLYDRQLSRNYCAWILRVPWRETDSFFSNWSHSQTSSSLKFTTKVTKYEQVNNFMLTCLVICWSIILILLQQHHALSFLNGSKYSLALDNKQRAYLNCLMITYSNVKEHQWVHQCGVMVSSPQSFFKTVAGKTTIVQVLHHQLAQTLLYNEDS